MSEKEGGKRPKRFVGKSKSTKVDNGSAQTDIEDFKATNVISSTDIVSHTQDASNKGSKPTRKVVMPTTVNQVPDEILQDKALRSAINTLPANYNFEIYKSVWQIKKNSYKRVGLQLPEGLQMYALIISDILSQFCDCEVIVMGDVTYGACCVDDFTAKSLGCDFLLHYGHSCLVPVNITTIKTMYVFVDIAIDTQHFLNVVRSNFEPGRTIYLVGTIQFVSTLHYLKAELSKEYTVLVPQAKPLSSGELLGCTAPKLEKLSNNEDNAENLSNSILVYLGDGRFHLESIMIANPYLTFHRYDPYSKKMTREYYNYDEMVSIRETAVTKASQGKVWGLIVGTLGRQGSTGVMDNIIESLKKKNKDYIVVLLSEIFPYKLSKFKDVDCWIQISCPRLSIDWGYAFDKPLLTPYEASVALERIKWQEEYPMDFYAYDSLGPWTPNHISKEEKEKKKVKKVLPHKKKATTSKV